MSQTTTELIWQKTLRFSHNTSPKFMNLQTKMLKKPLFSNRKSSLTIPVSQHHIKSTNNVVAPEKNRRTTTSSKIVREKILLKNNHISLNTNSFSRPSTVQNNKDSGFAERLWNLYQMHKKREKNIESENNRSLSRENKAEENMRKSRGKCRSVMEEEKEVQRTISEITDILKEYRSDKTEKILREKGKHLKSTAKSPPVAKIDLAPSSTLKITS